VENASQRAARKILLRVRHGDASASLVMFVLMV